MSPNAAIEQGYLGTPGQVFVDKISLLLPNPALFCKDSTINGGHVNYGKLLHNQAFTMLNDEMVVQQLPKKLGYRIAFKLGLECSHETVCVYLLPKKNGKNLMRIDFNPQKIGTSGIQEMATYLNTMLIEDCWNMMLEHGYATRVDSTVDLWGVDIEQVWVTPKNMCQSIAWKRNGRVETIVFGSTKSCQIKVYDKAAHLGLNHPEPITRVEHKRVGNYALKHLHNLANPFLDLSVLPQIPPMPHEGIKPWNWTMFCDSVKVRGPMAAIANLPLHQRTKYRRHLKSCEMPFWQPQEFWKSWPTVVANIQSAGGLLKTFKQAA